MHSYNLPARLLRVLVWGLAVCLEEGVCFYLSHKGIIWTRDGPAWACLAVRIPQRSEGGASSEAGTQAVLTAGDETLGKSLPLFGQFPHLKMRGFIRSSQRPFWQWGSMTHRRQRGYRLSHEGWGVTGLCGLALRHRSGRTGVGRDGGMAPSGTVSCPQTHLVVSHEADSGLSGGLGL